MFGHVVHKKLSLFSSSARKSCCNNINTKIKNPEDGNLEGKKVGGITITKKVGGGIVLSTEAKPVIETGDTQPKLK